MWVTLALTLIGFFVLFGWKTLDPFNTDLVVKGGDFSVSYLGSVFYRLDEWRWPIFTHMNLAYPYGISVHGTDGSPLLSIIFKALHSWFGLRADAQFVGIWMFISYLLQAVASVLIFRHAFKSKFLIVLGAMFFVASPIMMMRVFVHINLMPHFILLFAILLFLNNRLNLKVWASMAVLISLGILTCPYFLPMIGGFFAILIYRQVFEEKTLTWLMAVGGVFLLGLVFWFWFWQLGMLTTEQQLSSGGWRSLALNLTALFNPIWSKSQVFNTLTPKADFDADNYFGLGLLLALILTFPSVKDLFKRENLKKHAPLALLLCGFVVFALSSQVKLGTAVVLDYKPGPFIDWLGGVFRYSGRFFWPVWYLLAFFILKTIGTRFGKKAFFIIPLLLCVQIWDLYPTYTSKRNFVVYTQKAPLPMKDKEWERLDREYNNIFIFAHNDNYRQIWRWALAKGKNVNYGFLNRPSRKTLELVNKVREQVLSGYVESADYFYIIDSEIKKKIDELAKVNPAVENLKSKIKKLDGFEILEYDTDLHQAYLEGTRPEKLKIIPTTHRYWMADLVQIAPYRVYRLLEDKRKDYASILKHDDGMLILKWDLYGTEEFKKESDGRYHQIVKE